MKKSIYSATLLILLASFAISGNITGKVKNALNGNPIQGAIVEIFFFAPDSVIVGRSVSGADGSYTLSEIPNGTYMSNCYSTMSSINYSMQTIYNLKVTESDIELNIDLKPLTVPSTSLSGIIRRLGSTPLGTPVYSAQIKMQSQTSAKSYEVNTNTEGAFCISDFENGNYKIEIYSKGCLIYTTNSFLIKESTVQFILDPQTSGGTTGVNEINGIPEDIVLSPAYPNPFNPTTNIHFSLPKAMNTELTVYNMIGQKMATLCNSFLSAGTHNISVNASNWPSGAYIYKISTEAGSRMGKMLLSK